MLIIDPATDTADTTTLPISGVSGASKWYHGVAGLDGKIYGMPHNAITMLVIDPVAETVDTSIRTLGGNEKWRGAVLAPSGRIVGIPFSAPAALVVETPARQAATAQASISVAELGQRSRAWDGGVVSASGKVFGIPHMAEVVLMIDPEAGTASAVQVAGWPTHGANFAWSGGVLAPDGGIYGIPYNERSILVIDPASETASTVGGDSPGGGECSNGRLDWVALTETVAANRGRADVQPRGARPGQPNLRLALPRLLRAPHRQPLLDGSDLRRSVSAATIGLGCDCCATASDGRPLLRTGMATALPWIRLTAQLPCRS